MNTTTILVVIDGVLVTNVIACWRIVWGVKRRGK